MKVPVGFFPKIGSFLRLLPFFFLLLILGMLKALIIGPLVVGIIGVGSSAVIIGLWPAHFIWTYYCMVNTKRFGMALKILILLLLPVPLILWPIVGIAGSILGGIGYGYFAPLIATFEAVGENVADKFYHCFVDGFWSTLEGSFTVLRDLVDFCFHSYFSFMDELSEKMHAGEKPMDIRLSRLPGCLLVILLALPADVLSITAVALWKSPYMLCRGWQRLLQDLLGREGPFLETVCVPFAGLAIILWPIAVIGAVMSAFIASFFLAFYAGAIVQQEDSICLGLAYIVAVVSLFDEYANDLLYLKEGSCLPRPRYRKIMRSSSDRSQRNAYNDEQNGEKNGIEASYNSKLVSERSKTLKGAIQHYMPIQVLDWLFKSCDGNGRVLLREGLIDVKDIEECIVKGNCKKLGVTLPAWCIFKCLLASAKSNSPGLVISDEVELRRSNWQRDKVWQWFVGPLLIMKEQIKALDVDENEEACLRLLIMRCKNETSEDWDVVGYPSNDHVRRAQLQAIIRRLQGIVASMSMMPTFRRRFQNLVKALYLEAVRTGALTSYVIGSDGRGKSTDDDAKIDEVMQRTRALASDAVGSSNSSGRQ
ncbi:hypothetical protein Nepgr_000606 [Nepenthes gracilis]|uniref:Steroid nuclear receptor ligand-binding n=1 Tax=Nepenthes gracilis TaxID=150966 RepID=A0AAD3P414_NEPGR|nr:hypothetical protein Nepgr_000606 [Nepenthes gracilis]